ncbi:PXA domain-containing protein [Aphelenchoides besseyi]|nr:PXA domain-containing protein [Aphelenchoides besseyi]
MLDLPNIHYHRNELLKFRGLVLIRVLPHDNLTHFDLDCKELEIDEVREPSDSFNQTNRPLKWKLYEQKLTIYKSVREHKPFDMVIEYEAQIHDAKKGGLFAVQYNGENGKQNNYSSAITLFHNTIPQTQVNAKFVQFERTPPMSPFLFALVVGDISTIEGRTKSDVLIRIGTVKEARIDFNHLLKIAIDCLETMEEVVRIRYSLSKLDHIDTLKLPTLAMQNWGLVFYATVLIQEPEVANVINEWEQKSTIMHETSHQYFSNLVTARKWGEEFLHEAFASAQETRPRNNAQADELEYLKYRQIEDTIDGLNAMIRLKHPIVTNGPKFDEISYLSAGAVIRMIEEVLGRSLFDHSLHIFLKQHAYKNVGYEDFINALVQSPWICSTKLLLNDFVKPFLLMSEFPIIFVDYKRGEYKLKHQNAKWNVPVFVNRGNNSSLIWILKDNSLCGDHNILLSNDTLVFNQKFQTFAQFRFSSSVMDKYVSDPKISDDQLLAVVLYNKQSRSVQLPFIEKFLKRRSLVYPTVLDTIQDVLFDYFDGYIPKKWEKLLERIYSLVSWLNVRNLRERLLQHVALPFAVQLKIGNTTQNALQLFDAFHSACKSTPMIRCNRLPIDTRPAVYCAVKTNGTDKQKNFLREYRKQLSFELLGKYKFVSEFEAFEFADNFFYWPSSTSRKNHDLQLLCESYCFRPFLPKLFNPQLPTEPRTFCNETQITGSTQLDRLLEEIINILVGDFIDPWFLKLTKNREFQYSIKEVTVRTLKNLAERLRRLDWVALLTRDFVDDIGSHFRLFRISKEKLAEQERLFKTLHKKPDDLESIFFDFEFKMDCHYCHDLISSAPAYESAILHDLTDVLLYLLLPSEHFRSRPLRFLIREIFISKLILPVANMFADPDYLNRLVIWLLSNTRIDSEDFVAILQTCDSVQDLEAMLESIQDEIGILAAKNVKSQSEINSLEKIIRLIKKRMQRLTSTETPNYRSPFCADEKTDSQLVQLPLLVVLTNNVAVARFSRFLIANGRQAYLDCYLAIEGFNSSVEHQLRLLVHNKIDSDLKETMKEAALFIYYQYLAAEVVQQADKDALPASWFEQIQSRIFELLSSDRNLYPAFRKSESYKEMLEELEVLPNAEISNVDFLRTKKTTKSTLSIEVGMIGVGQKQHIGNEVFAIYNVRVKKLTETKEVVSQWNIHRRYSTFLLFHNTILQKYPRLSSIPFPNKKVFNNLNKNFLEQRRKALNTYMNAIIQPEVLNSNIGLEDEVLNFLSQQNYLGATAALPRKIVSAVFDPIRQGVKAIGSAVTQMPDQFNKAASNVIRSATSTRSLHYYDPQRVAANVNLDDEESIPLHMLILFVDELFGLQSRNQWFRRRIVETLRQFLHVTYGQSLNRKILSIVQWLTSEEQLAQMLVSLRNGLKSKRFYANSFKQRHPSSAPKTKLLARCLMLSAVPTQIRFAFGETATIAAVVNVSDIIQHSTLNRRLFYVLIERLLVSMFPSNNFKELFTVLHSKSPRAKR